MHKSLLFICLFLLAFSLQISAQPITVQGSVKSGRIAISQASVTFIDEVDTTKKYNTVTDASGNYQIGLPTAIAFDNNLPKDFQLAQNYPNPFSSSTAIPYNVNKQSDIKVTIYDILGRIVRQFRIGSQTVGLHKIIWDGRNKLGYKVANGIYLYKLEAGGKSQIKKMILNSGTQSFLSIQQINLPRISPKNDAVATIPNEGSYIIRIENTENTLPYIIFKQIDNITVNNDTTINIEVDYLPTASIDFDSLHQRIRGFGAANICYWYPDMTASEIQTAFGTGYGQLGFTILRLMVDPNSNSWGQNIATAKAAYDMGVIVFASPWYAPGEMTEVVGNRTRVRPDMYAEYAAHLDSFATFMENNGVPLYCISIQNEPDWGEQGNWTDWTDDEMFTFMRDYAHLITVTRVLAPESLRFRRAISDPILNDATACANLDIVGGHLYGGGLFAYPLAEEKGKEVWMTEHYTDSDSSANLWPLALDVATEMNNVMLANMNAYVWWQIVRYYSPISDGEREGDIKGTVTKRGYIMSQFSKFIRPGDYRVESSIYPSANIHISAYSDSLSSKEVIVATNTGSTSEDVAFKLSNLTNNTFTPYTTSKFKSVLQEEDIYIDDNNIILNLDASSITTFISN